MDMRDGHLGITLTQGWAVDDRPCVGVEDVTVGDRCWAAGLRAGDHIFAVNGETVDTPHDTITIMERTQINLQLDYLALSTV